MGACLVVTICLLGESFVFRPTTALRKAFGECLPLQKAQWLISPGNPGHFGPLEWPSGRQVCPQCHSTGEPTQQRRKEALWHHVVSGFCGWALETIYPSFRAPRQRSRN